MRQYNILRLLCPKQGGLYCLVLCVADANPFFYVGETGDLNRREKTHIKQLLKKIHPNAALNAAVAKYGLHNFVYVKIRANFTLHNLPPEPGWSSWLRNFVAEATTRNLDWNDRATRIREETAWIAGHSATYMSVDGQDCSTLYNSINTANQDTLNKKTARTQKTKKDYGDYKESSNANGGNAMRNYLGLPTKPEAPKESKKTKEPTNQPGNKPEPTKTTLP